MIWNIPTRKVDVGVAKRALHRVNQLRLLKQLPVQNAVNVAMAFEKSTILESLDKV